MVLPLTLYMKSACLDWLRFEQRCTFLATEIGAFSSDVMGLGKNLYEIEIKTSKHDFLADFNKGKHLMYAEGNLWTPDFFYFCVPSLMVVWAIELMKEKDLPYGIMEHGQENKKDLWGNVKRNWVEIAHRAKRLKTVNQDLDLVARTIRLRMGSEICRGYHKIIEMAQGPEECK